MILRSPAARGDRPCRPARASRSHRCDELVAAHRAVLRGLPADFSYATEQILVGNDGFERSALIARERHVVLPNSTMIRTQALCVGRTQCRVDGFSPRRGDSSEQGNAQPGRPSTSRR
jgi:hypothetical protein